MKGVKRKNAETLRNEGMHVPLINSSQTSGNTWYLQAAVTRTVADTDPHLRTNSTWSP